MEVYTTTVAANILMVIHIEIILNVKPPIKQMLGTHILIWPHLLIILSEGGAHGIFVDCLYNADDFSITVTDGHAEDGLSLVAC